MSEGVRVNYHIKFPLYQIGVYETYLWMKFTSLTLCSLRSLLYTMLLFKVCVQRTIYGATFDADATRHAEKIRRTRGQISQVRGQSILTEAADQIYAEPKALPARTDRSKTS